MFEHRRQHRSVVPWVMAACLAAGGLGPRTAAAADTDPPAALLPGGAALADVDFHRHVLPLLSKLGCNAGNCHGSFQGRGGFRLSLFGHAPDDDLAAIRDRVDSDEVAASPILAKPSLRMEHGGGRRFAVDSWEDRLLAAWIRRGTPGPRAGDGAALPRIRVTPAAACLAGAGAMGPPIEVRAALAADAEEIVTPFCLFESSDPAVVEIDKENRPRAVRPGLAQVIVGYAGGFATLPVTVPFPIDPAAPDVAAPRPAAETAVQNPIDACVARRLAELNLPPAPAADDAQFLRRATLDVVGRLPTVAEIREFLNSRDPDKRAAVIDRLLASPQHASLWATRWCDVTGCALSVMEGPAELQRPRARMWHAWFRRRVEENMPLDQIARGVLCGTSRGELSAEQFVERELALLRSAADGGVGDYADRPALDLYWRRVSPDGVYPRAQLAERTAAAFLGVRLECARCHKHPYDRWTQADYASFVNLFASVAFGSSTEVNREILARLARLRRARDASEGAPSTMPRVQEVYDDPRQAVLLVDPRHERLAEPRLPGGPALAANQGGRDALADWLTQPDNPYFARNWVNRVWAHYFGRGLVEPVDGFSARNPPAHQELLDLLAAELIRARFDQRWLERLILTSRTYQQSSVPPEGAPEAARYYSCAAVRPLLAEAMVQALDQVAGAAPTWSKDLPDGGSVWDVAANQPADERLAYLLALFGRGRRESVCDCDRSSEATMRQTLHLMSDGAWLEQLRTSPLVCELAAETAVGEALATAFLRTLSRPPSAAEAEFFAAHVTNSADRQAAWVDVVWALVNSREFRTNH